MSDYDSLTSVYDGDCFYDTDEPTTESLPMATAILELKGLSVDEVIEKATTLKTKLTGNATFTTPNPTLATLQTLITSLQTARDNYAAGVESLRNLLLVREQALDALLAALRQEVSYIQATSGGDAAKITSAGVGVKSAGAAVTELGQVQHLVLTLRETAGKLDAMWDPVKGAKFYELQTASDPNTEASWKPAATCTGSRCVVDGLTSGARVWVRVRAKGARKLVGEWSDPAVRVVL